MRRPTFASIMAAIVVLAAPGILHAQQQPAPADAAPEAASVNVLQVRRACLNRKADATLRLICQPPTTVSLDSLSKESTWSAWQAAFVTDYAVADSIRAYSDSLDTNKVTVLEIFDILGAPEQWRVLMRFGQGKISETVLGLSDSLKAALATTVLAPEPGVPAPASAIQKAFRTTRENLAAAGTGDSSFVAIFDRALAAPDVSDSLRLDFVSRVAAARGVVIRGLLGNNTVGHLTKTNPQSQLTQTVVQAAEAPFAPSTAQPIAGGRLTQSSLVWGATDFVVDRVQEQVQTFALQGFARRLCDGVGEQVLRESCMMIRSSSIGISRPGVALLRGAVSRDLEALPFTGLDYAYTRYRPDLIARNHADVVKTALLVTELALHTARGTDPLLALSMVADSFMASPADTVDAARFPVASVIQGLSALHATRMDPLRIQQFDWGESELRDMVRYQVIAMAANLQPRARGAVGKLPVEPWKLVPVALAVDERFKDLRALKRTLDERRRTSADTSSAVRQARMELVRGSFGFVDQVLLQTSQVLRPEQLPWVRRARQASLGVQEVVFPMMEGNYSGGLLALNRQVRTYVDSSGQVLPAGFTRGVTFVSELADASSSDQVNAALVRLTDSGEGFVGKRKGEEWGFALNAFGGLHGGIETANDETAAFGGLYLPVGLAVTLPGNLGRPFGGRGFGNLGTVGAFFQALDLGALASWRLSGDDSVEQRPEVGFAQVFSPGAFLVWNIAGAPVTIGVGGSWAPELRELDDDDDDEDDEGSKVAAVRWGLFLGFDIPLFP
jgi:hypothetical protein